ncbi:glycosyltransferase family 2 protein, partial [Candidatus Marithrix sp. Canyon 246]
MSKSTNQKKSKQSNRPLISVIVRTQNRPHLLAKALQSIAAQTYPLVETVVVNDGGSDVADVVSRFKSLISQGVQLIEHEQIRGRSAAANSGLQAARGVWVSFLDDDDSLEPEGLARLAKFIDWDKDIIYGQVQVLHMAAEPEKICKGGIFGDPHDMDSLLLNNTIPICAYICKRELAIAVGEFDEKFEFLEDWEFFYRLSQQGLVHYVAELIANYCIWGDSHITGKNSELEVHYRRKFFEKHLSSFSPDILQRTSLNFFEIMNRKRDDVHSHYHNLISQAEAEHANKLAHVQTAFERKSEEIEAANEHNKSLAEANQSLVQSNQKQHDRMLQLDIELRHIQAAFEQKVKEIEATNQHNKSLIEANQKQHDNILQLDSEFNTTKAQLTEKLNTTNAQLTEKLNTTKAQLTEIQTQLAESQAQLNATLQEKQWCAEQVGAFQQCQQQTQNLQIQVNQLTHKINRDNQRWVDRMREVMRRTLMPVVFDTNAELLDLSAFGLTIELRGLIAESSEIPKIVPPYEGLDFPIPVLQGKTLQWSFTWQGPLLVNTLMLKIGTYCRVNRCHLCLSITPVNEQIDEPITAQLNGEFAKDSVYAAFSLDQPLKTGSYICQLSSPNADNLNNVLAVWLTTNHKAKGGAIVKNYNYVSPNRAVLTNSLDKFDYLPIISIVMPTYNTPERFLIECLDSVVNQIYPNWELCIADDASTEPQVHKVLDSYQQRFPEKIKITYCETNRHISATSNAALELATGEFIALLDHDDLLTEDALFEVVKLLNQEDEQIDLIYSDEDKWDDTLECF